MRDWGSVTPYAPEHNGYPSKIYLTRKPHGGICQVLADTIFSADMVLIVEKKHTFNPQGQMSSPV